MTSSGIALLVYDFRASGVVRNALRIAAAAKEAGLDVSLWPIRLQGDLVGEVPDGISVRPLVAGRASMQRDLDSLRAIPALVRALDEHRPKILFSAGNHTHFHAALAMLLTREREAIRFIGRASNAVASNGTARLTPLLRPFERFQYASMDKIAAVSSELAHALGDSFQIDGGRLTTIPNGVDLAGIAAAASSPVAHPFFKPGAPPVILGIGRLSRQKNFEGLIRAFARVRKERPARLLILGPGSRRRVRRLKVLAARLGVGADVELPGFVANPAAWLARASQFVLSSRWEGASNVLLEALACGCPVVATRAPTGVAEVMMNGRIGPLVPVGDDEELSRAMLASLAQPRAPELLKARAAGYSIERTLHAYVELLK